MKKYIISGFKNTFSNEDFNRDLITLSAHGNADMQVSDGYHTMDELYDHRITLFIALCRVLVKYKENHAVWREKLHSDGSSPDKWYILGIRTVAGTQITYHIPQARWGETEFAPTLDLAPEWDGHTPADVLERLKVL